MKLSLLEQYNKNPSKYLDTDKEEPNHKYISKCYSMAFKGYKNPTVLEIGLASGGSLLLWNDYFVDAKIIGIDSGADPRFQKCIENTINEKNIQLINSDAYDGVMVATLPNFDIIIDDGLHTKDSHLKCLNLYLPKLNPGGILVIEDIDDIQWIEEYIPLLPTGYEYQVIDTDRTKEYNNLLFLVKRPL
jgi:cephalosporin hydroxylase